ncbi:unnamed protein product [Sphenostylis stenocarpa]|uniref:Uncharacterized protein n=1 Tax=Sphenostylis stenocarpa TaxID=92480 RepID=A0AA86S846_9FABA|nr:unnamed protein product [Sphenostylis stenocarpa]
MGHGGNPPGYNKLLAEENYSDQTFLIYANSYGPKHSTAEFKYDQNCVVEAQEVDETKMISSNESLSPKPTTTISKFKRIANTLHSQLPLLQSRGSML